MSHPLGKKVLQSEAQLEDLAGLGLDATPEVLEFVNQLATAASDGAPLAQPYIEAGAIKIFQKEVMPGVTFMRIAFHKTLLAEMLKHPNQYMN